MSEPLLTTARAHLAALASGPRQTGTASVAAARSYCASALRETGFSVVEEEFAYSALPGRAGTPLAGAFSLAVLFGAARAATAGSPAAALAITLVGGVALALVARWAARTGILTIPVLRARGVNLVAKRGAGEPAVWLVAHVDSKSQPVPMALRIAALALLALVWIATIATACAQWAGADTGAVWAALRIAAALAAFPVIGTTVGNGSAGAVDNASGVAAVLLAAAIAPGAAPIGVVITDAEELGLAGARAWCRARAPTAALNCDGVDDAGSFTIMHSGSRSGRIIEAFGAAAATCGVARPPARHVLPGILVDAVALHDAGFPAVTLSRGHAGTLRRIHTSRDDLRHLTGAGIPDAAQLLAAAALELCSWRS